MKAVKVSVLVFAALVALKLAGCASKSIVIAEPTTKASPSPSASPTPGPSATNIPGAKLRLPPMATYLTYYGTWDRETITKAQAFPLIITRQETTTAEVAQLKAKGSIVLLYITVGEEYPGTRDKGDGSGPVRCDGDRIVPTRGGVAAHYLKVKNGNDRNGEWGSWYVNAGDPAWQAKVLGIAASHVAKGADGFFLDTVDTASPWNDGAACTQPGMVALISKLRAAHPDKYIVPNRGLFFFEKANAEFRRAISATMFENFYFEWKDGRGVKSQYWSGHKAAAEYTQREASKPDGFTVLVLDYLAPDQMGSQLMREQEAQVAKWPGWVNSFNDIRLRSIYTNLLSRGGF